MLLAEWWIEITYPGECVFVQLHLCKVRCEAGKYNNCTSPDTIYYHDYCGYLYECMQIVYASQPTVMS